jgi:hypothetical protein
MNAGARLRLVGSASLWCAMTDKDQIKMQIARCKRLARMSDDETARRLLILAQEYEERLRGVERRDCA